MVRKQIMGRLTRSRSQCPAAIPGELVASYWQLDAVRDGEDVGVRASGDAPH